MAFKNHKIKPYGKPDLSNANQTSNPKTDEQKVQAIADYLEAKLKGRIVHNMGKNELLIQRFIDALGKDKEDLKQYADNIKTNFSKTSTTAKNKPDIDKDQQPELKKVSRSKNIEIEVPGGKEFGKNNKNNNKGKK
ncbi:MAG: hypothetical protein F6K54_24285 [Okeania sp. SIO3B5]|uniref:hypothetical protein n=1 Tax=Okeania sp. SIO3B5 TaxID=2607811 RepID=UPI001400DBE3|nr:hypothetical protein [Okeania sp. SIO3B5]NEO55909.1 hypothetical protein [Okeania sp. SIO3B5]